jgi:hypothetical protein
MVRRERLRSELRADMPRESVTGSHLEHAGQQRVRLRCLVQIKMAEGRFVEQRRVIGAAREHSVQQRLRASGFVRLHVYRCNGIEQQRVRLRLRDFDRPLSSGKAVRPPP